MTVLPGYAREENAVASSTFNPWYAISSGPSVRPRRLRPGPLSPLPPRLYSRDDQRGQEVPPTFM